MKTVVVVGTVGIPACYGGFESLVENITRYKSGAVNYKVFCSSKAYPEQRELHNDAELVYLPLQANGAKSVPYDIWSLIKCLKYKPDVVLILGVSGCIFLPLFRVFSSSRVITNIDGLEWKRDKWSGLIKRFLKFSEKLAVNYSDVVVTDNQAISDYVLNEYGKQSVTIAYGGDHAIRSINVEPVSNQYALGLCRIEPENNVEMILEAFSKISIPLKFVGNWNNSEFGKRLKSKYSRFFNIELLDPIYDLDELYKLRQNCNLYLHGHSAGGTNPSLVEMMHFGCTIYAYDCSFNRYSTHDKADYFSTVDELVNLMHSISMTQKQTNAINMLNIAKANYTWEQITSQYEATYYMS